MKTIKIVLTGGPRGGKTSILDEVKKHVSKKEGCKLLVIPETATEISKNLVKPQEVKVAMDFQNNVLARQLFKENEAKDILRYSYDDVNIIFCDRGVIDNKAYLNNQKQFDALLSKYGLKELDVLDDYDLVLYLVSSSVSDNLKYETETNIERYEDKDAASKLDAKTIIAWIGHRNIKTIMPTINFQDKIDESLSYVDDAIEGIRKEETVFYEIDEKRSDLSLYNDNNSKRISVINTYLNSNNEDETEVVVTKRLYKDFASYFISYQKEKEGTLFVADEQRISENKYLELLTKYGVKKDVLKEELSFINDLIKYKVIIYNDGKLLQIDSKYSNNIPNNISVLGIIKDLKKYEDERNKKIVKKLI